MKDEYTPGPWTLTTVITSMGLCHKIGPFPWKEGKENHACIYVDYPGNGPVEAELLANARLIAAAPDLLEALDKIASFAPGNGDVCEIIAQIARTALFKAVP